MAQALIKATDHVHPDPVKDKRGAHKRGDIIVVMPDGHVWGAKEGPPVFEVISVPDSWLSDKEFYRGPLNETRAMRQHYALRKQQRLAIAASRVQERETVVRHRHKIDLDNGNALVDKLPQEEG